MQFPQKIVNFGMKIHEHSFAKVMRQTMISLFPFAALGSIAEVINVSILSSVGFIGNIFYITKWLPHVARIRSMFSAFSMVTVQILAVLAAYQAAVHTARLYRKNSEICGMTGMISFLIIVLRPVRQQISAQTFVRYDFNTHLLGIQGLLIGIIVGYLTGQIFRLSEKHLKRKIYLDAFDRAYLTVFPILITLGAAIIINQVILQLYRYQVPSAISTYYQDLSTRNHGLIITLLLGAWSSFLAWLGLSGPYTQTSYDSDPANVINSTFALKHHSAWDVPYKYTQTTLYHSFGTFGGVGSTLALVIAIIIVARTSRYHKVARWSIFPVIFNSNQSILLGIPVLFNPIYLIPFVITPVFNMLVAAAAIFLKIMPPVTYPTPLETPSVLSAFIGTGGNFATLLVGILVIVLDVLIYIPFVQLSERIGIEIEENEIKKKNH